MPCDAVFTVCDSNSHSLLFLFLYFIFVLHGKFNNTNWAFKNWNWLKYTWYSYIYIKVCMICTYSLVYATTAEICKYMHYNTQFILTYFNLNSPIIFSKLYMHLHINLISVYNESIQVNFVNLPSAPISMSVVTNFTFLFKHLGYL